MTKAVTWPPPPETRYGRADSEVIREKLGHLIGRKKHGLRECVADTKPADRAAGRRLFQRLWDCGRTQRRYRIADVMAILRVKGVDPLHFLDAPSGQSAKNNLRLFEPIRPFAATNPQGANSEVVDMMRSDIEDYYRLYVADNPHSFRLWPTKELSGRQYYALARERERGGKNRDGEKWKRLLRARFQADNLRGHWGLGSGPIPCMSGILFQAGVALVKSRRKAKRETAKAVSGVLRDRIYFIGVGDEFEASSPAEKRHQLAVQLGRLYLCDPTADGEEARLFAQAFLVPDTAQDFVYSHRHTLHGLSRCAQSFGVTPNLLEERIRSWRDTGGYRKWSDCGDQMRKVTRTPAPASLGEYY